MWPVSGWIEGDLRSIQNIQIRINNSEVPLLELFEVPHEVDGIDFFGAPIQPDRFHFCHYIPSDLHPEDVLEVVLVVYSDEGQIDLPFTTLSIIENVVEAPDILPSAKVAICMATYNPSLDLFKKQIESILNQTEKSWHLIINDDCSTSEKIQYIQTIVGDDPRVSIFRNDKNVGFYHNFETCLYRIHRQFEFVALADQDDVWFPNKLSNLIEGIGNNWLIYNDMEILGPDNSLISKTFWNQRSNHYKNFTSLMLANTVTGSASLFRTEMLSKLLPFPVKLGNAFHDHWMAVTAAIDNQLAYQDEVLQSYIQHNDNVTGYGQFKEIRIGKSTLSLLSLQRMKIGVHRITNTYKNKKFVRNNLKVYFDGYMRRKLQYEILILRQPHCHRKAMEKIFHDQDKAVKYLLSLHWKFYKNKWMTNNAELAYLNAIEVMKKLRFTINHNVEG